MNARLTQRIIAPIRIFLQDSRAGGILLLCCTFLSLILSNIPAVSSSYTSFWNLSSHTAHDLLLPHSVLHWINDGFMALFFFLAGMEIKKEMVDGELSSFKKSTLPVFCAIGGMIVPAMLYALFNKGTATQNGWGIPMATDIAFSLGIASLLGKRVPLSLKIFLTALAIIDDLGAIIVIALFYGSSIHMGWLLASAALTVTGWLLMRKATKANLLHYIIGILLWYCMFNSGIHATVAGVVFAFLIPNQQLEHLQHKIHSLVHFIIMPVFALANTAIIFPAGIFGALNSRLSWGIMFGLFVGKPLGICLTALWLVRKKVAELPNAVNWHHMIGAGILAGIGFTMSIFITTLAFADAGQQNIAKISILIISFFSMLSGYIWLAKKKTS